MRFKCLTYANLGIAESEDKLPQTNSPRGRFSRFVQGTNHPRGRFPPEVGFPRPVNLNSRIDLLDFIKHRKYVIVILLLIMSERQLNQNILCAVCILRNQPPVFMSAVFRPTVRYLCYIGILIDLGVPFDEYIFLSEYNRIFPILFPLIVIVYGLLLYS